MESQVYLHQVQRFCKQKLLCPLVRPLSASWQTAHLETPPMSIMMLFLRSSLKCKPALYSELKPSSHPFPAISSRREGCDKKGRFPNKLGGQVNFIKVLKNNLIYLFYILENSFKYLYNCEICLTLYQPCWSHLA